MGTRMSNGPAVPAPEIGPLPPVSHSSHRGILLGSACGLAVFTAAACLATVLQPGTDIPLIKAMNGHVGHSALLDHVMHHLTVDQLLQGVAFIALFWFLWFATDDADERARLLVGLAAASCAGILSRILQLALPTHPRPLHTASLGFVIPAGVDPDTLNHYNSFPSDHGALFFALAIVIWRSRPWLGLGALAWAVVVDVPRVYEGYHWPSDILGALGLSLLTVSLFQNQWLHALARRLVAVEPVRRAWFYLLAFLVTYQIATLFDDIRQIGRAFASIALHHDPFAGA